MSIEKLLHTIKNCNIRQDRNFNLIKNKISNYALQLYYGFKPYKVFSPIFSVTDIKLLKNLGRDANIVICSPDKSKGIVILNKCDYITKMNAILSDCSKFKKVIGIDSFVATIRLEDKINRMLSKLKSIGTISKDIYSSLYATGTAPGILYGLAKTHKPNIPLRPILAAYKTAMYNLAKFLVPLIQPYTTNQYSLKNSYNFYNSITHFNANSETFIVSYDVTSLYTNVPVFETINILCDKIFRNSDVFHGFNRINFLEFLKISVTNTYFLFNNVLYQQIEGLAMGNPLAPSLANIFLCNFEENMFDNCPPDIKPLYYRRYLDDTFAIFHNEAQADHFLTFLNNQHPNITFTIEKEFNNKLPFLDVLVDKNDNQTFSTSIYRKPSYTGLGLSFFSFLPLMYKISAIKTLIHRAYHLSSSYLNFSLEIENLKSYFTSNGYPEKLFDRCVSKFLNKIHNPSVPVHTVNRDTRFLSLPFLGPPSIKFSKFLMKLLNENYPQIQFKIAFNNSFKINSFFKFKDKLPDSLCSCVIYKYTCGACQATYIGSTAKQSKIRFSQHLGISHRTGQHLNSVTHSAPRDHCDSNDHPFLIEHFSIVNHAQNEFELRILESLHIYKDRPTLNIDKSSVPLFSF